MTHAFWTRRRALGAGTVALLSSSVVRPASAGPAVDLDRFDPFSSVDNYFSFMRPILFDYSLGRPYLDALWELYSKQRRLADGERVLMGMFLLWRTIGDKQERIRFSRAAQKMADLIAQHHGSSPIAHVWGAIFFGLEVLAAGVLDSVHLAPQIQKRLELAIAADSTYLYGLAHLINAKMYIKAPPFPVSVGNYEKGYKHLEIARPLSEGKFAGWYIILAEGELLTKNREAAFAVLDRMAVEIKPRNAAEAYALDSIMADGNAFRAAVESGEYNKYFWDSFLLPARMGLPASK